jgi:hypothetical protein
MGREEVAIAPPFVERALGSIRRECLDQVIVFNERQLRRVLSSSGGAAPVVGRDDVPERFWHAVRLDHGLVGRHVVPPSPHRFPVHRPQLWDRPG